MRLKINYRGVGNKDSPLVTETQKLIIIHGLLLGTLYYLVSQFLIKHTNYSYNIKEFSKKKERKTKWSHIIIHLKLEQLKNPY